MKKSIYYSIFAILLVVVSIVIGKTFFPNNENEIILADSNVIGDVDGNGEVGINDYTLIRKHILGKPYLTGDKLKRADIDGKNGVTSADYIAIRKIILGTYKPSSSTYSNAKAKVVDSKYGYIVANYNVLDYGADPTGAKDSTAAFEKALADAAACIKGTTKQCGGTVYAPKGKYLITRPLRITHYTAIIGDLDVGTTNGTVLMIKHSSGTTDYNKAAITIEAYASIQNIAFWYPDQRIDGGGNVISYPATVQFGGDNPEGATLDNLYFVNSYTAMDLASTRENNSIFFIRNIYGTPLHIGIINDTNYDTIKMSNINFSSKYWLNSGLSNVPSKSSLLAALRNANTKPTAMILERIDFFYIVNFNIENYYMGYRLKSTSNRNSGGNPEGVFYDGKVTDCYYPFYVEKSNNISLTDVTLQATGGGDATAFYVKSGNTDSYSISNSNISSNGSYAVYFAGSNPLSIVSSKVNGKIGKDNDSRKITIVGSGLTNTGIDGCSVGLGISINKKTYDKIYVNKPKSKNLIMIEANEKTDITSKIKDAINKLKSTGGIVYIPRGTYTISSHIDVASGIEIRGITPFAHHGGDGATVIETTYKGDTLFTLQSGSGIDGVAIIYPENRTDAKPVAYPYTIKGNGSNVYVRNVSLISAWNGIDFSSARCDNHYIEHIWGTFFNVGISVGSGSSNGVIRDNHFTTNIAPYGFGAEGGKLSALNQIILDLGASNNETILNTFVWVTSIGYRFKDGAKDFYAVGISSDNTKTGIIITGNATGQIICPLLYGRPTQVIAHRGMNIDLGVSPLESHYIVSTIEFTGNVNIFGALGLGNSNGVAFDINGTGKIGISGGIIRRSIAPAVMTRSKSLSTYGLVINEPNNDTKYIFNGGAGSISIIGNITSDGKSASYKLGNNAGINYTIMEPNTSCKSNISINTPEWQATTLNGTVTTRNSSTTKVCGLPISSGTIEYNSDCTSTKTASVSSGCATISLNACNKKQTMSYRLTSNGSTSSWDSVSNIGEYLILGQLYNQLLFPGKEAKNDAENLGYHVARCTTLSACIKDIGTVIVKQRANDSNTTYMQYLYRGLLGREADSGGLDYWVNRLNSGTSKADAFNDVSVSNEAKYIYSAWGYN